MSWVIKTLVCGILLGVYKMVMKFRKGRCLSEVDLSGKVAIVTGANQGIGFQVALDLATRNAKVILANRSGPKSLNAVQRIQDETGNSKVYHRHLDLGSMRSVREFCSEILKEETRLDILINNSAICGVPKQITQDGLEINMATNHFGPFLLTTSLLDLLRKSAPSRIIVTSSMVHAWGKINFDNLNAEKSFSSSTIYFDTKLANLLFARELSRKLEGTDVIVNSVHPGAVHTNLLKNLPFGVSHIMAVVSWLLFRSAEDGAQTTIHLAVSQEVDGVTGKYFSECRESAPSPKSMDDAVAKKLWEISEKLTGLA